MTTRILRVSSETFGKPRASDIRLLGLSIEGNLLVVCFHYLKNAHIDKYVFLLYSAIKTEFIMVRISFFGSFLRIKASEENN